MVRKGILMVFMGLTSLVAAGPTKIHTPGAVSMFMGLASLS